MPPPPELPDVPRPVVVGRLPPMVLPVVQLLRPPMSWDGRLELLPPELPEFASPFFTVDWMALVIDFTAEEMPVLLLFFFSAI